MDYVGQVGLLAGEGVLPVEFAKKAKQQGHKVMAVGVTPNTHPELANHVAEFTAVPLTQWGKVVSSLTEAKINTVFLLGSVSKGALYSDAPMDDRFLSVVQAAKDGRDNELFRSFAADLASVGITIGAQFDLLPNLITKPCLLTRRAPSAVEQKDIDFAYAMAKGVAGLDIGQTVVVKQQAVLAVEAIEGTNETLRRGAKLGLGDVVAVKVAKPNQDLRFDVPTIGPDTIRTAMEAGVRVLAFEAYRTLLIERDEMVQLADANDITLVAIDPSTREAADS